MELFKCKSTPKTKKKNKIRIFETIFLKINEIVDLIDVVEMIWTCSAEIEACSFLIGHLQ